MTPSKADHANICYIATGSTESDAIASFIESAAKKAHEAIKKRSRECELTENVAFRIYLTFTDVRPIGLGESTVRSRSSAGSLKQVKIASTDTGSSAQGQLLTLISPKGTVGSTIASFQLLPSLTDFTLQNMDLKLPCFVMPFNRNRVFCSQTQLLEELDKCLSPMGETSSVLDGSETGSHLRTFALCGLGRIGKT